MAFLNMKQSYSQRLIIYMEKRILDSDWLRIVKCDTGAKNASPVQVAHRNSGLIIIC